MLLIGASLTAHAGIALFRLLKNGKHRDSGEHLRPGWIETAKEYEGRLSGLETSREYHTEELSGFRTDLQNLRVSMETGFATLRERIDTALSERRRP